MFRPQTFRKPGQPCSPSASALLHRLAFSFTIPAWYGSYAAHASVFMEDIASTRALTSVRAGQVKPHLSDCKAAYKHLEFAGCSGDLFSKDSKAMPKLLHSAPRPSSPVFRAYSSPFAASDLVLGPHSNCLATPAWPQQTPYSILPNLPRTPIDRSIPVSQPRQALLQPPHHDPSQHFLQGPLPAPLLAPLPAPLNAPLLAPSQPSFQVPFQPPFREPFLDDLQPHNWHALKSALSLQT